VGENKTPRACECARRCGPVCSLSNELHDAKVLLAVVEDGTTRLAVGDAVVWNGKSAWRCSERGRRFGVQSGHLLGRRVDGMGLPVVPRSLHRPHTRKGKKGKKKRKRKVQQRGGERMK